VEHFSGAAQIISASLFGSAALIASFATFLKAIAVLLPVWRATKIAEALPEPLPEIKTIRPRRGAQPNARAALQSRTAGDVEDAARVKPAIGIRSPARGRVSVSRAS
jgi:hypothetical protein